MSDAFITIIAIFLAAILMFVFPLLSVSERNDDVSQLAVQTSVVEFVDNVRSTGKITQTNYDALIKTLAATGNSYDIELERKIFDENPGKKTTWTSADKIGENVYYSVYTSQIEDELYANSEYNLKKGDIISVSVKNTNTTISQLLKNFFYTLSGNDTYQIAAQHAGIVTNTGR